MTSTESTSSATPTGVREDRNGQPHLVVTRTFRAPARDVLASLTEAERLHQGLRGPRSGCGCGCVNPDPTQNWTLDLSVGQDCDTTTLRPAQVIEEHTDATHVSPGWEYQLDRLEAHVKRGGRHGGDLRPALHLGGPHYADAFG
ncbi:MAG: hypothetical protein LH468_08135 [Nocardioides sp.]|nr:hypothetical protein [Nocardioides sp.]